jgi:hypothetical protein
MRNFTKELPSYVDRQDICFFSPLIAFVGIFGVFMGAEYRKPKSVFGAKRR